MNKLLILLKHNIINSYGINKLLKHKEKKNIFAITLICGAGIFAFLFFFLYMYMFGMEFAKTEFPEGILYLGIILGTIVIVISTVSKTNSFLFRSKDFDMLMSLPIDSKIVFCSKLLHHLIITYGMFIYFYVPSVIVYGIFNQTTYLFWLLSFVGFFVVPLLPYTICGFISYLLGFIKINRKVKNIISIILAVAIVVLIMLLSFNTGAENDPTGFFTSLYQTMKKIYYPGYIVFLGIQGDIKMLLIFTVPTLLLFIAYVLFASKTYLKTNTMARTFENNGKFSYVSKTTKPLKALVKKEVRGFFGIPVYVINTIIGPILSVIITYFICAQIKAEYLQVGELLVEIRTILPILLIASSLFVFGIAPTTSSAISIEGKNFWIIKTLPVNEKEILLSKKIVNYLITIPSVIFNLIIANIFVGLSLVENIFVLLVPLLIILLTTDLGLYINIIYHKFDFDDPVKVVKQGISVLLTMIFSTVISLVLSSLCVGLFFVLDNVLLSLFIVTLILVILNIVMKLIINTKGIEKFKSIIN